MPDFRGMFDRQFIGVWDLGGKDRTVVISDVKAETISNGKQKNKKPVISFKGAEKRFLANVTTAKCIAAMYGNNTDAWIGKAITLYPTQVDFGGKTVDAIRVRPTVPRGPAVKLVEVTPDPVQRAAQNEARELVDADGVVSDANEDAPDAM